MSRRRSCNAPFSRAAVEPRRRGDRWRSARRRSPCRRLRSYSILSQSSYNCPPFGSPSMYLGGDRAFLLYYSRQDRPFTGKVYPEAREPKEIQFVHYLWVRIAPSSVRQWCIVEKKKKETRRSVKRHKEDGTFDTTVHEFSSETRARGAQRCVQQHKRGSRGVRATVRVFLHG